MVNDQGWPSSRSEDELQEVEVPDVLESAEEQRIREDHSRVLDVGSVMALNAHMEVHGAKLSRGCGTCLAYVEAAMGSIGAAIPNDIREESDVAAGTGVDGE